MWVIKAYYRTGDSYSTRETSDYLEYEWKDEDIAKENAKAIVEHYRAYSMEQGSYPFYKKGKDEEIKKKWWYIGDEDGVLPSLFLKLDDGRLVKYVCPWCGYFEHLEQVEVTIKSTVFSVYNIL